MSPPGADTADRLAWALAHAYEGSPFFRALFERAGIIPADIRGPEDLRRLPFTTKDDLRAAYPFGWAAVPPERIARIHASSGTTGKRTVAYYTTADLDDWTEAFARCYRFAGVGQGDRVQVTPGYGLWTAGVSFQAGAERAGAMAVPVGPGNVDIQFELMCDLQTTVLTATSSFALLLGEEVERRGLRDKLALRVGIFGSERWGAAMRRRIEALLGLESFDIYGLTELYGPGMGIDCGEHDGIHYWDDYLLVELIDPATGEPAAPGAIGEIVSVQAACRRRPGGLVPRAAVRYNRGMRVMVLPLTAESGAPTRTPDPVPLLEELATLRLENEALRAENTTLHAETAVLQQRIRELEVRLGQNSSNSSRPPSTDPPQAPPRPKGRPAGRKRGGQPGHRGACRALLPIEDVHEVIAVLPEACRHCGQPLPETTARRRARVWRHQVVELLALAVRVTEYQMALRRCPACGKRTRAELPVGVPRRPFGARLTAVIALLSGRYRLSRREVRQLLHDLWEVQVSLGAVVRQEQVQSAALAPVVEEARSAVQQATVVNIDETGWRQAKERAWLWTVVTATLTVFRVDRSRSGTAVDALLGPDFPGVVGSDRWSAYNRFPAERRALCHAHLKRDFQALVDRGGQAEPIGHWGLAEFERLFAFWHRFRAGECDRMELQRRLIPVQARLGRLLRRGQECPDRKAAGLCRELRRWWPALWTFARVDGVEPTNNGAERALRPAVLWRKGSFGSDSDAGSRFAEQMLTVVATCRQQGRRLLDFLLAAGEAALQGTAAPSLLLTRLA